MTTSQESGRMLGRRTIVTAVGAVGLATALTACGNSDNASDTAVEKPVPGKDGADAGEVLAKTADIPEGGGKIFADQGVVVTQPTAGQFKAFSSKCTHQGCAVTTIKNGMINCPCHGSQFAVADGSVTHDPATKPLPAVQIKVEGDSITLA
ncbi:Rieske 2Fe-2S domain-containing protein [Streptomyces sp. A5-4]|uniref:Rieske (2Fe-2S) protein n=1 Tax=Streptomyces sp. A5-4 TaxID=3384771 RepID=UPI003DA95179